MQYSLRLFWLVLLMLCLPSAAHARSHHPHGIGDLPASITLSELPPQGRATLQLIKQGGPFPYARDGVVFGNFEHRLPQQSRGFYHEYTVPTPGARNRGARRIICGPLPECYYTGDHYQTFSRIRE